MWEAGMMMTCFFVGGEMQVGIQDTILARKSPQGVGQRLYVLE